jgi:hypothetical protein
MTMARCIVLAACAALILVRATGLHVHWSAAAPDHDHAGFVEHHHHAGLVAAAAADHADRHAGHGEVDIDLPETTSGKLPTMPLLPALVAAILALVLLLPGGTAWAQRYRPPPPRRRTYLLPPPQGPPLAS